jgi:hypothetical protein
MQPKYDAIYRALVTSNTDSTNSGKIRVQCPQIAGLAEIRSAEPVNPSMPIPKVGSIIWIMFNGGDLTKPAYFGNSLPNTNTLIQDWTNFTLSTGFTGDGNGNGTPQFQVVNEYGSGKVFMRGAVNVTYPSSTIANGGQWAVIPLVAVPTSRRTLTAACSLASSTTESVKNDMNTDHTAIIVGTNTTTIQPPWVSFNGMSYYL